ncbi:MAG: MBL fold metallo-hydrolase [Euryarchaeota archaeon]|nr:MBL fold metallo-hydrolase [Euryarchaeota archaeon]
MKKLNLSVTNCFLIKADDHYVLIDTGYEDDWALFRRRLNQNHVELSDLSHIILTHHHNDHSGLLHNILRENNSIEVVTSCLGKGLLLKGKNDHAYGEGFLSGRIALLTMVGIGALTSLRLKKAISPAKIMTRFPPYRLCNRDTLIAGDTGLRDIGIPLDGEIIATPGHTADSISILFDDGDCLIGDAAENVFALQLLGAKYCTHLITDMDSFYTSWEKLIAAGARRIYPAHGCPFAVDKLKANLWEQRAENLVSFPYGTD